MHVLEGCASRNVVGLIEGYKQNRWCIYTLPFARKSSVKQRIEAFLYFEAGGYTTKLFATPNTWSETTGHVHFSNIVGFECLLLMSSNNGASE
jgi:hypothetical protein